MSGNAIGITLIVIGLVLVGVTACYFDTINERKQDALMTKAIIESKSLNNSETILMEKFDNNDERLLTLRKFDHKGRPIEITLKGNALNGIEIAQILKIFNCMS